MNNLLQHFFFSGASSITDLRATVDGGAMPGITAPRTHNPALDFLGAQGNLKVFIDSGAFGGLVNFEKGFDVYDKLCERVGAENVFAVMPDVYRDQEKSLEVLQHHAERVRGFIAMGCDAIVPFQRGKLSLGELYEKTKIILGTDQFRVGLPMAAHARHSSEEIHTFFRLSRPSRVHFLGKSFRPFERELGFYKKFHAFDASADASMLTNWLKPEKVCGQNIEASLEDEHLQWSEYSVDGLWLDIRDNPDDLGADLLGFIAMDQKLHLADLEAAIRNGVWSKMFESWFRFPEDFDYDGMTAFEWRVIEFLRTPRREFRYKFLREKVESYLGGTIFESVAYSPQGELELCA